jgi:hypothetical protein
VTSISPGWLIALYLVGWIPMVYLGMRINNRMWKQSTPAKIMSAYSRGWNHGFGYLQKIQDVKTEQMSSVTIHAEKV